MNACAMGMSGMAPTIIVPNKQGHQTFYEVSPPLLDFLQSTSSVLVFTCGASQFPPTQLCSIVLDADKGMRPASYVLSLGHKQATITRPLKFWDLFYSSKAKENWKSTPKFNLLVVLSPFSQTSPMTDSHSYAKRTSSAKQHGNNP